MGPHHPQKRVYTPYSERGTQGGFLARFAFNRRCVTPPWGPMTFEKVVHTPIEQGDPAAMQTRDHYSGNYSNASTESFNDCLDYSVDRN